jgi:hypothetical protein
MFIAALFTTTKLEWNQPLMIPTTDEQIKMKYTMEYCSVIKKMKLCHGKENGWNEIASC